MTTPITTPAAAKVTNEKEILTTPFAEEEEDNIERFVIAKLLLHLQ